MSKERVGKWPAERPQSAGAQSTCSGCGTLGRSVEGPSEGPCKTISQNNDVLKELYAYGGDMPVLGSKKRTAVAAAVAWQSFDVVDCGR